MRPVRRERMVVESCSSCWAVVLDLADQLLDTEEGGRPGQEEQDQKDGEGPRPFPSQAPGPSGSIAPDLFLAHGIVPARAPSPPPGLCLMATIVTTVPIVAVRPRTGGRRRTGILEGLQGCRPVSPSRRS